MTQPNFQNFLEKLIHPTSQQEQNQAWHEFLKRYKHLLEITIRQIYNSWGKEGKNGHQLEDVQNDIIGEVLYILCNDNREQLKRFRHPESEQKFRYWLIIICKHACTRHLRKLFDKRFRKFNPESLAQNSDLSESKTPNSFEHQVRWEYYEYIVKKFRQASSKSSPRQERDIHIFLLKTFSDFSPDIIPQTPCLKGISRRAIDNIIHRIRKLLNQAER